MNAILFTPRNSEKIQNFKHPTGENISKQKLSLYFKNRFPQVYNWLLNKKGVLKSSDELTKNKANRGGSLLAYDIQQMEAELWIHRLLNKIPEEMIYITIHDSVMIFNPTIEQVKFVVDKVKEIG
ncbi:MAG: hypothetical protein ABSG15_05640 [FCB group bacterium]|jgi:hypothetical protein